MKIVYLVGSLSAESMNRKLAEELVALAPEGVELVEAKIADLPLYNRDFDGNWPAVATEFKQQIIDADGVLLITPEHNRSFSAALHNALEWTSRPYGTAALTGKPVATIGASVSGIGTAAGQQPLRSMMAFFGAKLMGQPEGYINGIETGLMAGEVVPASKEFFAGWIKAFADFVAANK
ncbi:MAG: NAD(P)H-dependent oxidoreductase [Arcanobacterium sp.]|nr:NAD(P)H-dependent oxidoreductase [Arcanobacterium sp.]